MPKYLVMLHDYPYMFANTKAEAKKNLDKDEIESLIFIKVKLGEINF